MNRKPHPSSVLKTLPDEDQAALFEFLQDKKLEDGVKWLFSNNGVRTNKTSLGDWRGWYAMNQEIGSWENDIVKLQEQLSQMGTDEELIPKIGEAVFISRAAKTGDAKMYATVASVIQRHRELKASKQHHADTIEVKRTQTKQRDRALSQMQRKLDQAERRVAALEEQAEAAKKAAEKTKEALKSGGMDEATRQQLMQEMDRMILGKVPEKPKAS